jgi:3-isopropylmalate/(R)-2-methylmalate dehydratase small subunit
MKGITQLTGRGISIEGNDIDTDRIIPARYLKEITFSNMGKYPFFDERFDAHGNSKNHPFNEARFQGASILIVNKNFGCGSSREHAPQALMRFGIQAIVGESFAEIFAGNCTMLGMPVVTLLESEIQQIQKKVQDNPQIQLTLDFLQKKLLMEHQPWFEFQMHPSRYQAIVHGTWDSTGLLLGNLDKIKQVAQQLPYLNHFQMFKT